MILYLHGFRSSPSSFKAQRLAERLRALGLEDAWVCPQLPASPAETIALCHQLIAQHQATTPDQPLVVVGSSLGGYYAAHLAEHYRAPAVLLNPVVHAARDLRKHVGSHTLFHSDEPFHFLEQYVAELEALAEQPPKDPQRYYLLACTGDEVLDWQEMADHYAGSQGKIIQGSDHGISDFAEYEDDILAFILEKLRTTTHP